MYVVANSYDTLVYFVEPAAHLSEAVLQVASYLLCKII